MANGTNLATQELFKYNGTTESLTFNHTDASGTGAQTTRANGLLSGSGNTSWGRTAEYSPLGRNVADASPYITLNTNEPVENGGVNMFGSGQGYRPGQTTYRIDGMVVPESQFMEVINSGQIGGAFGLLEMAARMSVRDYSVKFYDGNMQLERFFGSEGDAKNFAFRMNQTTVFKNILVSDAWSVLAAISAYASGGGDGDKLQQAKKRKLTEEEKKSLRDKTNEMLKKESGEKDKKETCLDKLNKVLTELGSKYTDFNNLLSDVFSDNNGYKLRITKKPVNVSASASTLNGSIVLNSSLTIENHNIDFIHEVFHAANKKDNYSHLEIVTAIASVEGLSISNFTNWYKKNAPNTKDPGGGFINSFIGQYCTENGSSGWNEWLERFK